MDDKYKEIFDQASDEIQEAADGFVAVAYRGEDGYVCVSYEDEPGLLANAIASTMIRNEDFRTLILGSVAIFAKRNGNVININQPGNPSLN